MKKIVFLALLVISSLNAVPANAAKSSKVTTESTTETKARLTEEEINSYKARVEEIRNMDKSSMTSSEKKELKNELKDIKAKMHKDGTYFYIGGSTLIIIILLLLLL